MLLSTHTAAYSNRCRRFYVVDAVVRVVCLLWKFVLEDGNRVLAKSYFCSAPYFGYCTILVVLLLGRVPHDLGIMLVWVFWVGLPGLSGLA